MSGLIPLEIKLQKTARLLELRYENGEQFKLSHEFLRVFTPSAEARGHGPGQETLQDGKADIYIKTLQPVGNYAIQPTFSDGHNTGIYSWDMLHNLCIHQEALWQEYLRALDAKGLSRFLS